MEFRILGPLEVWQDGQRVALGGPQQRALLAVLLLDANRVVSTERLVDRLWGELPPPTARGLLQGCVAQLRKVLRVDEDGTVRQPLLTRPPGYLLEVRPGELDLDRFEELVRRAREAQAEEAEDGLQRAAALLHEALALWRGPVLEDIPDAVCQIEAVPLEERRLTVLEERIEVDLRLGRHAGLVSELQADVRAHPLRERLWGQLMLALYRAGRQAEAVQAYRDARQVLVQEVGLEPSAWLQELQQAILACDPSLELPATPSPSNQSPGTEPPSQLPVDLDDFTGRQEELARLQHLLEDDHEPGPAVVITGKAGVGKTTLAVRAAHRVRGSFPGGQLYVNLRGAEAQALDPAEVLADFLHALGVHRAALPEGLEQRARLYRTRLAGRRVLVVADNAANEAQVRPLLPGGRSATLVTSRLPLAGLAGARLVELDVLPANDAVELLAKVVGAERLAAEPAAAQAITRLCGRLPLAVRIAGSKLAVRRHWPLAKLVERLSDQRHQLDELRVGDLEVRSSVALSYDGLADHERRAFRLLGLLQAPDFPAWILAALLHGELAAAEDLLERLVDIRLLDAAGQDVAGQLRYRFHDLLRVFARERLDLEESAASQRAALLRVLGGYLALTGWMEARLLSTRLPNLAHRAPRWRPPAGPDLPDAVPGDPVRWFAAERPALVAAVEQAHQERLWELTYELAAALAAFFEHSAQFDDWRVTHLLGLDAARQAGDRPAEALMRNNLGELSGDEGRLDEAMPHYEQALSIFEELGDRRGKAMTMYNFGEIRLMQGQLAEVVACYQECLPVFLEFGDRRWEGLTLISLAKVYKEQGRLEEALAHSTEALSIFRGLGDRREEAYTRVQMASILLDQDRVDEATTSSQQCLSVFRELGDPTGEASTLLSLSRCYKQQGRLEEAIKCVDLCLRMCRDQGFILGEAHAWHSLGQAYQAKGLPDEAIACLDRSLAICRERGYGLLEARALMSLGTTLASSGNRPAAESAWRRAGEIFRAAPTPDSQRVAALLRTG